MGIFSKIKDAIFGHHGGTAAAQPASGAAPSTPQPSAPAASPAAAAPTQTAPTTEHGAPVDVGAVLTQIWQEKGEPHLNWKVSIADLMRLLDLDPSLQNREELAGELGYQGAKDGSAEMNIWLYKRVMEELEKNGGKVPADLKGATA
jgi:hypothetical protein